MNNNKFDNNNYEPIDPNSMLNKIRFAKLNNL